MAEETHVLEQLPAHALGVLEAVEASQVDAHLLGCTICRAELRSWQAATVDLALAAPPAAPPADLKDRLMERVSTLGATAPAGSAGRARPAGAGRPSPGPWWQRLLPAWSLASLLLIVALGAFSLAQWQRLNRLETVTAPGGMRAVALAGTEAEPLATGFVLIGADGRNGAMVVDRLPPLGEDREYQVWLIRNGERTSGAVFATDEDGYRGLRLEAPLSLFEYDEVGVTIEPAGGSPQPTGPRVLGGPLFQQ